MIRRGWDDLKALFISKSSLEKNISNWDVGSMPCQGRSRKYVCGGFDFDLSRK